MKDRRLASNYAGALLSILTDPVQAEQADSFLQALRGAIDSSQEFRDLLRDPAVPRTARRKVLAALAAEKAMPATVRNFLGVVVDHNRTDALGDIATAFHRLREERLGVVPAEVVTAAPLGDDLRRRVQSALEARSGQKVRLTCRVQPDLIGGAVTRIGSRIFDGSLRTQLQQLRRRMVQE